MTILKMSLLYRECIKCGHATSDLFFVYTMRKKSSQIALHATEIPNVTGPEEDRSESICQYQIGLCACKLYGRHK